LAHIEYRHVEQFFVILSAAKNLFEYIEMLRFAQHVYEKESQQVIAPHAEGSCSKLELSVSLSQTATEVSITLT
jgi:hypothetical protein